MLNNHDSLPIKYSGKKVLVTGGAGFVGSNVSKKLVELGAQVTILDDLTTGNEQLIPPGIYKFINGSVTDKKIINPLVSNAEYIFHLAARVLAASTSSVEDDYTVNIGGIINILSAAILCTERPPIVVYTSTSSVYGNPRALPILEEERPNILSPYAASKFAAESYCNVFHEMNGLPVVIVRYSNVYGPNQSTQNPYCGVISKFIQACLENRPMEIHGSGLQTRDFTYVEDAVAATLLAGSSPRAIGNVFNIGSGFETNIRELATQIGQKARRPYKIHYINRRDIDNVQRRVLNIEKARRILRWIPETPLDEGLDRTFTWFYESALT